MINSSMNIGRHFFKPHAVAFFCILITLIGGILFPRLFAYLPALSGLILGAVLYAHKIQFLKTEKHILICILSVLTWAGLSALWSVNPEFSIERTTKIALILLPGFIFYIAIRSTTLNVKQIKILLFAFCVLSIALFWEKFLGHPITSQIMNDDMPGFKLNRHFLVLAFVSLPFLYFLKRQNFKNKTLSIIGFIIFIGLILTQTYSQTAQLCFWVGIFFLFCFTANKNIIRLFFIGLMILSCLFPFMVKPIKEAIPEKNLTEGILLEASIIHRFEIWEYSSDTIMKKALMGHGIDSLRFLKSDKWMPNQQADDALHSHNVILQLWVEFGVMGAVMLVMFLFMAMEKIVGIDCTQKRKFYLACFATSTCCAMTAYGFWQSWQLGFFMFFMGFCTLVAKIDYKALGNKNQ